MDVHSPQNDPSKSPKPKTEYPIEYWIVAGIGLVIIVIAVGYFIFPDTQSFVHDVFFFILTLAIVNRIIKYIQKRLELAHLKRELIARLGSADNQTACRAAEDLTRNGWLSDGSLQDAILCNANFKGANLRFADLRRADLSQAILVGANLFNAYLEDTILHEADLRGADLTEALLRNVRFDHDTQFDTATTLPDGKNYRVEYDPEYWIDPESGEIPTEKVYLWRFIVPDHPNFWTGKRKPGRGFGVSLRHRYPD